MWYEIRRDLHVMMLLFVVRRLEKHQQDINVRQAKLDTAWGEIMDYSQRCKKKFPDFEAAVLASAKKK